MFEINTSLYACIEQLFKWESLLEKCISTSQVNLSSLYTIKGENIATAKQQSQFIGLGSLFFWSCCFRELYNAQYVHQMTKRETYTIKGEESTKNTLGRGKVLLRREAVICFAVTAKIHSKLLGQEATA